MDDYYCVIYEVDDPYFKASDTYQRNFPTLEEAQKFHAIKGGDIWRCNPLGTRIKNLSDGEISPQGAFVDPNYMREYVPNWRGLCKHIVSGEYCRQPEAHIVHQRFKEHNKVMKKLFHISDVLSCTTERLVSNRHMDGVYGVLNFMHDTELFTHALPMANDMCQEAWKTQFPQLVKDAPGMPERLEKLDLISETSDNKELAIQNWVYDLRTELGLPEYLEVESLPRKGEAHACIR